MADFGGSILNTGETWTVGPNAGDLWTNWNDETVTEMESSVHFSVDSLTEWQLGGDKITVYAEAGLGKIFTVGASYDVYLPYTKQTTERSYSTGALSTHQLIGTETTTVRTHFNGVDPSGLYNYRVTPYLYWARGGYLALDYLTEPVNTAFWSRYDKPDPAFVLPWRDGQCPGKELFSKDIVIDPPFANIGETVEISATVHNFSPKPLQGGVDVTVRFCLGDPASGCDQIGGDQVVTLDARDRADAHVLWQVRDGLTGMQQIYAVIDPDNELAEMHDAATNPELDNNVAFGTMQTGDSGYLDPGGVIHYDYQYLSYTDTQGLPTFVFVPTAAVTETARLQLASLRPTPAGPNTVARHHFALSAYKGGSNRDQPWDLTFGPMPAAVLLHYSDGDVAELDENSLVLHTYNTRDGRWEDAACGEYVRYPENNWMLVPICRTGSFALLGPGSIVYLPLVMREA